MINYTLYKTKVLSSNNIESGFIEKEVLNRLLGKLDFILLKPQRILCIGNCCNLLISALKIRFPHAEIIYLNCVKSQSLNKQEKYILCDIDTGLPFQANTFDFIISNLVLHKLEHTEHFIREIKRILEPEGMCLFSLLGMDTLKEISSAWKKVDNLAHVHDFYDMHDIGDLLLKVGFLNPVLDAENLMFTYTKYLQAFADIKDLNDPLAHEQMRMSLTGKNRWNAFIQQLKNLTLNRDGKIQMTYEIIYGHVIKPKKETAKLIKNQVTVTLDSLKQSLKRK